MIDATHWEIERLKRLHQHATSALVGLQQLPERSPEDELRLRAQMRLTGRLSDRIQWMEEQCGGKQALAAVASPGRTGGGPDPFLTD